MNLAVVREEGHNELRRAALHDDLYIYVPTAYLPRATLLEHLTAAGGIIASACTCAGPELRHPVLRRAADLAREVRVVERVQAQPHVPPRAELVELHPAVTARVEARHDLGGGEQCIVPRV